MHDMGYQQINLQKMMQRNTMAAPDMPVHHQSGDTYGFPIPTYQPGNMCSFTMPLHQQPSFGPHGYQDSLKLSPPVGRQNSARPYQVGVPQRCYQSSMGYDVQAPLPQMVMPPQMATSLHQELTQHGWKQPAMSYEVQAPLLEMTFPPQQAMPSPMAPPLPMATEEAPKRKVGRPPGSTDTRKRLARGTLKYMTSDEQRAHRGTLRDVRKWDKIAAANELRPQASESEAVPQGWTSPRDDVGDVFPAVSSWAYPGLPDSRLFDDGSGDLFFDGTS